MASERTPLLSGRPSRRNILSSALAALLYVVAFGMVTAYSAPACVDMRRPGSRFVDVTEEQITWIASLPGLAGVVGNAVSGHLSNRLGRKAILLYVSASYAFGWLLVAYSPVVASLYAGRLVTGFCAGVCAVAVPAYLVEISAVEIRGLLSAGFQTAFAAGVFLVMALGAWLRWSWLAIAGATVVVGAAALTCLVPESPPWLVRKSRNAEAFQALRFLRIGYDEAAKEFREIVDCLAEEPGGGPTLLELLSPALYKPAAIAVALMFFQQFSGINALMANVVELFQSSDGGQSVDPSMAALLVALVQVLATVVGSLLMDRAGRRALYAVSGIGMTLSLAGSGAYHHFLSGSGWEAAATAWRWVPLTAFAAYIATFSLGFGSVPFVVTPELVPTHSRSFLLAVANVSCSLFSFVATKIFDDMRGALGLSGLYWTYASVSLLGVCFYLAFVPETKGRTIREIHRGFSVPGED